jgi:hypothetical protein
MGFFILQSIRIFVIMKKYLITFLSTLILEIGSTMYISTVANNSPLMVFWAFIGPFLSLPFVGYMVESKDWKSRLKLALASSTGYSLGSLIVYLWNNS